jgi:hypothetical protein
MVTSSAYFASIRKEKTRNVFQYVTVNQITGEKTGFPKVWQYY